MQYKYIFQINVSKTEVSTNNGQSRDTSNIGHARHRTKTNKTKQQQQSNKKQNKTPHRR